MSTPENMLHSSIAGGVLTVQSTYLSYHLIRRNLKNNKVHLNGYLPETNFSHPAIEGEVFKEVLRTLEKANDNFMAMHKDSVMRLVLDLDTSDGHLHSEFLRSASQIVDEIRWGRICSLFFLTSLLAERLIKEGQGAKVEGLVMWLAQFLNDNVKDWIAERGGWGAVTDALKTETPSSKHVQPTSKSTKSAAKAAEGKGSWFTLAAIGVGALVVGSLAMR